MKKTQNKELQPLNMDDSKRLAQLEGVLKRGIETFFQVGEALLEISTKRLYRETHASFTEYMEDKWGWTKARAHQLMDAAKVVKSLPDKVSTVVDTERKARALKNVTPKKRAKVIEVATVKADDAGEKLNAKHIKEAAAEVPGATKPPATGPNYGTQGANANFYTSAPSNVKPDTTKTAATGKPTPSAQQPVENLWAFFVPDDHVARVQLKPADTRDALKELAASMHEKHGTGRVFKFKINQANALEVIK